MRFWRIAGWALLAAVCTVPATLATAGAKAGTSPSATASAAGTTAGAGKAGSMPPIDRALDWPLTVLHADELWRHGEGNGVTIAVVDTGIDGKDADLAGAVVGLWAAPGVSKGAVPADSHGSEIAGLIAGRGRAKMTGLAPRASLIDIRVAAHPVGVPPTAIARGITEAVADGARIINVSVSAMSGDRSLRDAVNDALRHGCLVVAAAAESKSAAYPAAYPGILTAAAMTSLGHPVPSSQRVSLYSPGVKLFSTVTAGGYSGSILTGNDYATADVSAAAALLLSAAPGLKPQAAGADLIAAAGQARTLDPEAALAKLTPATGPVSPRHSAGASHSASASGPRPSQGAPGILVLADVIAGVAFLCMMFFIIRKASAAGSLLFWRTSVVDGPGPDGPPPAISPRAQADAPTVTVVQATPVPQESVMPQEAPAPPETRSSREARPPADDTEADEATLDSSREPFSWFEPW